METDTNALEGRGADGTPAYSCPITPGSRLFRTENNPLWKVEMEVGVFSCSSHKRFWEEKNEVMPKRIGNDNETKGGWEKTAWVWDFLTVKDCTFSKSLNVENNNNH